MLQDVRSRRVNPSSLICHHAGCCGNCCNRGGFRNNPSLKRFPDAYDLSPFAECAVRWAVEEGLLQGNAQGSLNPTGSLNRAEGATILMRYSEMFG